jgi:GNAT superfamily N-acetyltransferase
MGRSSGAPRQDALRGQAGGHAIAGMAGSSAAVSIRPATSSDLEAVLEHRVAMLEEVFPAGQPRASRPRSAVEEPAQTSAASPPYDARTANREWLTRHLGDDFEAWIAEVDGQVAGSAAILWFPHPPSPLNPIGLEAYILNVFTESRWRRRGVARALMNRAVDEARTRGAGASGCGPATTAGRSTRAWASAAPTTWSCGSSRPRRGRRLAV